MASQVPAVIAKIISLKQKFTYGENQIAQFVIHNSEFISQHTITALANEIGVSETSINRFCKKIGFKGFNDFKIAIAQDTFYREMQTRKKNAAKSRRSMDWLSITTSWSSIRRLWFPRRRC